MTKTKSSTFYCCVALVLFTLSWVSLAMMIKVKDEQFTTAGKRRGYVSLSGCFLVLGKPCLVLVCVVMWILHVEISIETDLYDLKA